VSAVGHEVDVTISDLVADLRAPTPSAAAEAVAPDAAVLLTQLGRMPARLEQGLRRGARRQRARVEGALDGLTRGFRRRVDPMKQSLDLGLGRLERRARALTSERRSILAACSGKLEALSPLGTLARGYAVARTREGRVLKARADFPPGLEFRLRVLDGTVIAQSGGIEGETADE
jgi:exodeoxyribonuclease VII large subunit